MANAVQKQSQELANQLWAIANDLRGNMDASKFKNYILGVIFYRYLSEKTENYMNDLLKDDGITYREALKNEGLISGEEGQYGLMVDTVDGQKYDYNKDGAYWAFYVNGAYANSGVDTTPIKDGEVYSFVATKA